MLRIGIIGYGRRIAGMARGLDIFDIPYRVTAVADPRGDEIQAINDPFLADARFYGTADGLLAAAGELDGIMIGTRCNLHTELALKVAPTGHTAGIGNMYRNSKTNYVFNHLGGFAAGAEYFARALFLGGVTNRFPGLSFGFLEGGAGWAMALLNDIVEHFEKRNVDHLRANLDPAKLDVDLLAELFDEYGDEIHTGERVRAQPRGPLQRKAPDNFNEFEACGMTEIRDLRRLFVEPFYFGCEADDRMTSVAFNRRLSPVGAPLKAMFGSDIGHWDVMDAVSILSEAWSLVEAKLLDEENFRDFTFTNPAMLHLTVNPGYFEGTVLEDDAARLLAGKGRVPAAAE